MKDLHRAGPSGLYRLHLQSAKDRSTDDLLLKVIPSTPWLLPQPI